MNSKNLSVPEQASADGLEYIKPKLNEMQAAILAMLKSRGFHGATDSEIAIELGLGDNARKRRGELCKDGYVVALDMKRPSANGYGMPTGPTKQTVWVAREFGKTYNHVSEDIKRIEDRIGAMVAAARRLKRSLRKEGVSLDDLYSKHTAVADAFASYNTNFHVAWRGMRAEAEDPMLRVGDQVVTTRGVARVTVIHRTTQRYEKYGTDVDEVSWAKVRDGFVVVDTDNGHWSYGNSISPVEEGQ
jgi:hypothetical protein